MLALFSVGLILYLRGGFVLGQKSSHVAIRNFSSVRKVTQFATGQSLNRVLPIFRVHYGPVPERESLNYWQNLFKFGLPSSITYGCNWENAPSAKPFVLLDIYFDEPVAQEHMTDSEVENHYSLGVGYCLARAVSDYPTTEIERQKWEVEIMSLLESSPIVDAN
jgi:hypothetical protein